MPDLLALSIALIMSFGIYNENITAGKFLRWQVIPFFAALIVLFSMMQAKPYRVGLLRFVAQSKIMLMIGYASYPIYLLQQVLLNYYAKWIYDTSQNNQFQIVDNSWFGNHPWWWKLLGLIGLLVVCWPVQRYFQDTFVAGLFSRFIAWKSSFRSAVVVDDGGEDNDGEDTPLLASQERRRVVKRSLC